jgi:hypothetical protein
MIGALLNTVQTTLLGSRGFLLTSLLPVILFTLGSYLVDSSIQPAHTKWIAQFMQDKPGFTASAVGLLILILAYMFSSVNSLLREILEGKLLRRWPNNPFLKYQMKKAEEVRARFDDLQRSHFDLSREKSIDRLRTARQNGSVKAAPAAAPPTTLRTAVDGMIALKSQLKELDHATLTKAVADLAPLLEAASANDRKSNFSVQLSVMHVDLVQCVQYELGRLERARVQAYWESATYPEDLAPTRLGNIAGTLTYYAKSRYGMLLDVFWTRLQKQIQADEKMSNSLQDAKVQLDFFVSLVWVSGAFSLFWSIMLIALTTQVKLFLMVSAGGYAVMFVCYQLACQSYVTFGEVVRGAVDMLRFQLISAYHLPLPAGSNEEKQLWSTLADWVAYDSRTGDVLYDHKTP